MTGEVLKTTPEVAYRKIKALNQSAVGTYATSPLKFYQEFILGSAKEEESSVSLSIGTLTHFRVLQCRGNEEVFQQRFDEQFVLNKHSRGTKQVFVLADELFQLTRDNIDSEGKLKGDFTVMFQEAFQNIQNMRNAQGKPYYGGKDWKKALVDFNDNGKEYYDLLTSNIGKTAVDELVLNVSKRLRDQLFENEHLGWIFREGEFETFNEFPIEFSYKGWDCKAEIDKILIDHKEEIIYPKDLKCTYLNEEFEISYLKNKYYIQNGWYWLAIKEWASENDMENYIVAPMDFIAADSSPLKRRPLLYATTEDHIGEALKGFTYRGKRYKGINSLLDEIRWANDNGIWNITAENYNNKSIVHLPQFDGV